VKKLSGPLKWNEIVGWGVRIILILALIKDIISGKLDTIFPIILALLLTFFPNILEKRFRVYLPSSMQVIIILFIFASEYLGELNGFYYRFWWWDIMLHTTSGFLLGIVGFMFVYLLNEKYLSVNLSPFFIVLFAFCFAITMGVFWEFYEFGMDRFLGFDMQKFRFPGEDGLVDTMTDLIVDTLGALVVSILGYMYIKEKHDLFFSKLFSEWFRKDDNR